MDDAIDRACQILTRYEALNYAVYRHHVMVDVIDAVSHVPQDMFWELFSGASTACDGQGEAALSRLPCPTFE